MRRFSMACWLLCVGFMVAQGAALGDDPKSEPKSEFQQVRVAVFPLGATSNVEVDPDALTDQVETLVSMLPGVTLVNRVDLEKTAQEQKLALSGLVDADAAVKIGKVLNAQYILVGRASKIGQTYYLVLKLVDVETTRQTTIAAEAPAENGMDAVLKKLKGSLTEKMSKLDKASSEAMSKAKLKKLRKLLKPLKGKSVLVEVSERHVGANLDDPAAQMAVTHLLSRLDIQFIVPKDPVAGWKKQLLKTGTYEDQKVDYLLEGEGVSEFAGRVQGLASCRARVELRWIKLPGQSVMAIDKGVASGVDLTESLSSKSALEKAGTVAAESLLRRAVKKL